MSKKWAEQSWQVSNVFSFAVLCCMPVCATEQFCGINQS